MAGPAGDGDNMNTFGLATSACHTSLYRIVTVLYVALPAALSAGVAGDSPGLPSACSPFCSPCAPWVSTWQPDVNGASSIEFSSGFISSRSLQVLKNGPSAAGQGGPAPCIAKAPRYMDG